VAKEVRSSRRFLRLGLGDDAPSDHTVVRPQDLSDLRGDLADLLLGSPEVQLSEGSEVLR
jgi:hypothetical protein